VRRDLVPSVVVAEVILFMSVHLVASGWAAMVRPPFPVPNGPTQCEMHSPVFILVVNK
jgi:hypothetical protein